MSYSISVTPSSAPRFVAPSRISFRSMSGRPQQILRHKSIICSSINSQTFNKPLHGIFIESVAKCGLSLAASFLLISAPPAFAKEEIFGIPRIVDGDTLVVDGTRIRLFGIDAPESKQSCSTAGKDYECGTASKNALQGKIGTSPVRCAVKRKDMYGRSVAICKLDPPKGVRAGEDGLDLNAWLVKEGWAVAYKRYSKAYVPLETQAQEERKGIWSGKFEDPEKWRKEHNSKTGISKLTPAAVAVAPIRTSAVMAVVEKIETAAVAVAPAVALESSILPKNTSDCLIKGNITAKGAKIYHVPGGRFYEATKIDKNTGERFFCNEEEALAAGWRASKE
jgi:endonuclease YncB( thermonuclease family)